MARAVPAAPTRISHGSRRSRPAVAQPRAGPATSLPRSTATAASPPSLGGAVAAVPLVARLWRNTPCLAIARRLAEKYHVVTADLRNHGRSDWDTNMTYPAMASDIAELIRDVANGPVHLIGHSMGGKASMVLTLSQDADLVADLVVVDIAPVTYDHDYTGYISAMKSVDFDAVSRRAEVEDALVSGVSEKGVRQFLAQNVATDKETGKMYYHHTGYPGGLKEYRLKDLRVRKPEAIIQRAVKGMMAKNALNRHMLTRLKVYTGAEHPHQAQQPQPLSI